MRHFDTVGIVGGGYAGMAAAVALAARGIRVTVFEAARQLGGRARSVAHKDALLDNGQHVLIGAYRETLALLDQVGTPRGSLLRLPLQWNVLPHFSFRTAKLPAPWHLGIGLLRAKGMSVSGSIACARFLAWCRRNAFRLARDMTAAALIREHRQDPSLVRCLWEPLCVAALNTPLEQASAQVFLTVLRDGLAGDRVASELVLPRVDLSTLFPAPAAEYVRARGGEVRLAARVVRVDASANGFTLTTHLGTASVGAVILATQPAAIASIAGHIGALSNALSMIAAMSYQPIITIYLRYATAPRMPFPMQGLMAEFSQWIFDRATISAQPGLVAVVISARGRAQDLAHDELTERVHAEIAAAYPGLSAPEWSQVIEEKRATFSCTPGLARPDQETPVPGLLLAGDYTRSEYPATIEAAVRSGLRCAELAGASLAARRA